MSQFHVNSNLVYRLVVDNTQAKAAVRDQSGEVTKAKAVMKDAGDAAGDFDKAVLGSIQSVTRWVGPLSAVVAVFGGLAVAVKSGYEWLVKLNTESAALPKTFGDATATITGMSKALDQVAASKGLEQFNPAFLAGAAARLKEIDAQLATLNESLTVTTEGQRAVLESDREFARRTGQKSPNEAINQTIALEKERLEITKQIAALKEKIGLSESQANTNAEKKADNPPEKKAADSELAAREALNNELAALEASALEDKERLMAEAQNRFNQFYDKAEKAGADDETIMRALDAINEKLNTDLDALQKRKDKDNEADLKRIKDKADAEVTAAQRASDAWRRFRDEQIGQQRSTQIGAIPIGINTNPAGGR